MLNIIDLSQGTVNMEAPLSSIAIPGLANRSFRKMPTASTCGIRLTLP